MLKVSITLPCYNESNLWKSFSIGIRKNLYLLGLYCYGSIDVTKKIVDYSFEKYFSFEYIKDKNMGFVL